MGVAVVRVAAKTTMRHSLKKPSDSRRLMSLASFLLLRYKFHVIRVCTGIAMGRIHWTTKGGCKCDGKKNMH